MNPKLKLSAIHFIVLFTLLVVASDAAAAERRLTVMAGDHERLQSVVTFPFASQAVTFELRDEKGHTVPAQWDASGRASFILDQLPKSATKSFKLIEPGTVTSAPTVKLARVGKKLKATFAGKAVFEYQAEAGELPRPDLDPIFKRGGYLHPVLTPSGRQVTDDYPSNHKHHHGIWFPWTKTEFEGRHPDFWNMGDRKGRVEFVALDKTWSGPVHGGFVARHRFVDLTAESPKAALNESWEVRVYAVKAKENPYWMFDLVSTQECASSSPLTLLDYYYGGLGFRGNWDWNGPDKTFFLTSEGETDRVKGNQTRARWCHVSGLVNGQQAGLAIFCHPENFRAPQPTRLHPTEPFFCFAPSQLGDFQITPGKPYVSRYRFIVQDGPPDRAQLDRLWNDYAHPPEVKVE